MFGTIHEECGVFGIYSPERTDVAQSVYYGLYALQHRGQESCGVAVSDNGKFHNYKDVGLVNDVLTEEVVASLGKGEMAVGHVRYGTTGNSGRLNAQPIMVNHLDGHLATVHNGNLVNAAELRRELERAGCIFHTTSDTEIIAYVITRERITAQSFEQAVLSSMDKIKGAYSLVVMDGAKLIALRDVNGFRPLCYGKTDEGVYVVASETCALDAVNAHFVRDILPGELVTFDKDGVKSIKTNCGKAEEAMCIFEYIYFARPDSVIDGASVHDARIKAGEFLAQEHPVTADVVIGVPDSGLDAAVGYSRYSKIPYEIGFIKNKYIGRTFISPGQDVRADKVRIKLNPVAEVVKDKRVVLIDDSIVRGTTSARIVKLLRNAGAKEVHMRVSAPPFIAPCYYGTDIDSKENLIANNHTVEEICKIIGADSLGYLNREHLKLLTGGLNRGYCDGCFTDRYKTQTPNTRKDRFEE